MSVYKADWKGEGCQKTELHLLIPNSVPSLRFPSNMGNGSVKPKHAKHPEGQSGNLGTDALRSKVAELEREYILQRQREGIAIAKEQGKYTGRKAIQHPNFERVVAQWRSGEITAVEAMRTLNMSKTTFYRRVNASSADPSGSVAGQQF